MLIELSRIMALGSKLRYYGKLQLPHDCSDNEHSVNSPSLRRDRLTPKKNIPSSENLRLQESNERHSSETVARVSPEINKFNINKKQHSNNSNNNRNHTRRSLCAWLNVHDDIPKFFEIHMIQRLREEVSNVTLGGTIQRVDKTLCNELP